MRSSATAAASSLLVRSRHLARCCASPVSWATRIRSASGRLSIMLSSMAGIGQLRYGARDIGLQLVGDGDTRRMHPAHICYPSRSAVTRPRWVAIHDSARLATPALARIHSGKSVTFFRRRSARNGRDARYQSREDRRTRADVPASARFTAIARRCAAVSGVVGAAGCRCWPRCSNCSAGTRAAGWTGRACRLEPRQPCGRRWWRRHRSASTRGPTARTWPRAGPASAAATATNRSWSQCGRESPRAATGPRHARPGAHFFTGQN